MITKLIEQLLVKTFNGLVKRGSLLVIMASGKTLNFGDKTSPHVTIRFASNKALLSLLIDPDLKLGELFMNGLLIVEKGTIYDFLELFLRDSDDTGPGILLRFLDNIRMSSRRFLQRNRPVRARRNVAHHYDLDDRLYSNFLDSDRQYSCAYFEFPGQSLDDAQLAKKRHVAAKLLVEPGHKILDIGCGWGGLTRYLTDVAGAGEVTGITLSKEQIEYARDISEKSPNAKKRTYRMEDYRATEGKFNRIVSVGMFEHVGLGFYGAFFNKCRDLMADDGVMLLHFIGNSDVPDFNNPWIEKYIFPGGHLSSLSECMPAIERSGLIITDIEIVRLHYAQTLRLWRERFLSRRSEIKTLYDERFCKMWEFYLSMSETAFRYQQIAVFQIQLAKRQENVPLTRGYIEERENKLRQKEIKKIRRKRT